jgi:threonine synthase
MQYISTRGAAPAVDFVTACLAGLAPDGGLYIPESWPQIAPARPEESYIDVATRILSAFAGDAMDVETVRGLCEKAYGEFAHHSVAPLVQAGPNHFIMELHHGPTLAFKDVAMQFIAQLYDHALTLRGERMSVVCATSGDTGGAAAAAFAGARSVDLFILHPHERVSPVQRLFMTTTGAPNVHNFAVDSDFDACQAMVKAMFADRAFAASVGLSGVNSINWARIAAQAVYYATAQAALGPERALRFVVPSGNMGDALAGYVAARCGLLAGFEAVCAVNENRALETLFSTGQMRRQESLATPSPAMDITVPSNFERILFEASGRDPEVVRSVYETYSRSGSAALPERVRGPLSCTGLSAQSVRNAETLAEMARYFDETGTLICPHTAVGTHIARQLPVSEALTVTLSTAHAAKFPETVSEVTRQAVPLPARCAGLSETAEVFRRFPNDLEQIRGAIEAAGTGQ